MPPKDAAETFPCPICGKPATPGSRDFPFCRERCRLVDLGKWLREDYRISSPLSRAAGPGAPEPEDEADEGPRAPGETDEE